MGDFLGSATFSYPTRIEKNNRIGDLPYVTRLMGRDDDNRAGRPDRLDLLDDAQDMGIIKLQKRLIEKEKIRWTEERTGKSETSSLTTTEFLRNG